MGSTRRFELALEIGEEAVRQGQWQQALTCFQTALSGLHREPRVYGGLGDTHLALADRGRALSCYKEAARLAGDSPHYTEKVAGLQERLGLLQDAAASYLTTGDLHWSRGQSEAAEAAWEHALRLQDGLLAAHERLAQARQQQDDAAGVVRHYLAMAGIMHREGRYQLALQVNCAALQLLPDDPAVWAATEEAWRCLAARRQSNGQGPGRVESGDLLSAATDFAQWQLTVEYRRGTLAATDGGESRRDAHLRRAILHESRREAGPAIVSYERAIAAGLRLPAAFFVVGLLYRLVGRREDCRAAFLLAARHPFYRRAIALLE